MHFSTESVSLIPRKKLKANMETAKEVCTPETTESRIMRYAIIQTPQKPSELTHSSLRAFTSFVMVLLLREKLQDLGIRHEL